MATPQSQADAVKAALASPSLASASTVTTLQSLLSEPSPTPSTILGPQQQAKTNARASSTAARGRNVKTPALAKANTRAVAGAPVDVHQDAPRLLSPKERYKLATDAVNIALKTLTDVLKPQPKAHRRVSSARTSVPNSPKHARTSSSPASLRTLTRTPSQRALQLRSANDAAAPASPAKPSGLQRTLSYASSTGKLGAPPGLTAIAECARLGFSHLRMANMQKLGVKELPKLQLETGMLALSGKMIAHGLESLAVRELRVIKRRLEDHMDGTSCDKTTKAKSAAATEKETLASMLRLPHLRSDLQSDALPLVITYQTHVLRIIASQQRPATIEAAVEYLELTAPCSPAILMLCQASQSSDPTKAAKQLEQHAQILLSLCRNALANGTATNPTLCPSPEAVVRLQCLALQVRKRWWTLACHEVNLDKELLAPFGKSLAAFARRSTLDAGNRYALAQTCCEATLGAESREVDFRISRTMSSMAQSAGRIEEASSWADTMANCAGGLQARLTAVAIRRATLSLLSVTNSSTTLENVLEFIAHDNFHGAVSDIDTILAELSGLRNEILDIVSVEYGPLTTLCRRLVFAITTFVEGCFTRLPDHSIATKLAELMLDPALYCAKSSIVEGIVDHADAANIDQALQASVSIGRRLQKTNTCVRVSNTYWMWQQKSYSQTEALKYLQRSVECLSNASSVEKEAGFLSSKFEALASLAPAADSQRLLLDALNVHVESGVLARTAKAATKTSLAAAFATDDTTAALGRALRLFIRSTLRCPTDQAVHFDSKTLPPAERAVLLEWQLLVLFEHVDRSKYHFQIRRVFLAIRLALEVIHTNKSHPLRRARLAMLILRLADALEISNEEHTVAASLTMPENGALHEDNGLAHLYDSIKVSLELAQCFYSRPRPSKEHMRAALLSLQKLLDNVDPQIDDAETLAAQLEGVAAYLEMQGEEVAHAIVLKLLVRVHDLNATAENLINSLAPLAAQYVRLCFPGKAGAMLARAHDLLRDNDSVSAITRFRVQIVEAEYQRALGAVEKSHNALEEAEKYLRLIEGERGPRFALERAHADFALVHSKLQLESGSPLTALAEARRAVKLLSMVWSTVDRGSNASKYSSDTSEPKVEDDSAVEELTGKASKLVLVPAETVSSFEKPEKGATFWPLVASLVNAMLHISDLYAHHGLFVEAKYYSDHASKITESMGSGLIGRVKTQRSRLLIAAGKLDEASLCFTEEVEDIVASAVGRVEISCAVAELRTAERSWGDALTALDQAQEDLERILFVDVETFGLSDATGKELEVQVAALTLRPSVKARSKARVTHTKAAATARSMKTTISAKSLSAKLIREKPRDDTHDEHCILQRLRTRVNLQRAVICLELGNIQSAADILGQIPVKLTGEYMRRALVEYRVLMRKAAKAMQSDFTFSVLPESTISLPALARPERRPSEHGLLRSSLLSPPQKLVARVPSPSRKKKAVVTINEDFADLLREARDCVVELQSSVIHQCSTARVHELHGMLLQVTVLMSATATAQSRGLLHPMRAAFSVELPRTNALQREAGLCALDRIKDSREGLMSIQKPTIAWPYGEDTAAAFQRDYVDTIPKLWTVVSLSLSENCDELYLTRYRSGQTPFILRQPLSRHNADDPDQEPFDFAKGRAELREIISLSNYSCHATSDTSSKGAKTKWWNEREALDRRLHELLLNIEQIWLGGFKGVFSLQQRQSELLARFRKSLESIIDQHLPSRKAMKKGSKKLVLDHRVLELLIGLGDDQDGVLDLDEPIADLLYFIVDILQFNGERNAYDEIDFDTMTVEVLDALRAYHDVAKANESADQHLILVLDKRLHSFPWESMPCLENLSVSRVSSMLSLRQRVLAMQRQESEDSARCVVPRTSGTYILNPSSDLTSTQEALSGPLAKLSCASSANAAMSWKPIINRAPTESDFQSALECSSILLYFGHGAGSQYIRPRTIKKLHRCSEVIWLMGCSSGAVTEYGELEPQGVPLAYLLNGRSQSQQTDSIAHTQDKDEVGKPCMAVVATLWDVTDKDIDRFSVALGEEWGLWARTDTTGQSAKTPKTPKRKARVAAPETPPQPPKTPKTPRVPKTPVTAKTPARSFSRSTRQDGKKRNLADAVARSRDACYLRYLNGAASVVYGVPVWLEG